MLKKHLYLLKQNYLNQTFNKMKALKLISTIIIATGIVFYACERVETPEQVAEKFLNHLENAEYDKASQYGTEGTHEVLEILKAFEDMEDQFGSMEDTEPREIKDVVCEVEGDFASCTYMADDQRGEVELIKKDGEWLVDIQKEAPF